VRADPSRKAPDVDCFYVYPTVDLSLGADNHQSFDDLEPMARATIAQAAHFGDVCRLYVPLYRQATIGAYLHRPEVREQYLSVAASDILDAFLHYMGQYNQGHRIVLIGHSQGAEMIIRLLRRVFDDDPLMQDRLLVAMPIGGDVNVPKGGVVGGTFSHLPLCRSADEKGCVIAYRSYVAGSEVKPARWAPPPGQESACVNPAALLRGPGQPFSEALFPLTDDSKKRLRGVEGITTSFVAVPDFYTGRCEDGPDGYRYLAVAASPKPGDARVSPVDLGSSKLHGELGLHVLDLQFEEGDLVQLVARKAATDAKSSARASTGNVMP
jgi:hypothetical protein